MAEIIDSRVLKMTLGAGVISKPQFGQAGQRVYCVNCGQPKGFASLPADGLEGIIYICRDCEQVQGIPPLRRANLPEPKE